METNDVVTEELKDYEKIYVVKGQAGSGKTRTLIKTATAFSHQGIKCLFISLEDTVPTLVQQFMKAGVDTANMSVAWLPDSSGVPDIEGVLQRHTQKGNTTPQMLFIDSIMLARKFNELQELAKKYNITIYSTLQTARTVKEKQ
jgi:predicted ATP-dependent serine protease